MDITNKVDLVFMLQYAVGVADLAAQKKLEELQKAGPRFSVHSADLFTGKAQGPAIGTMLDNCGGAWICLPGKCKLVNSIKKHFRNLDRFSYQGHQFEGSNWYISKGTYKGYTLHLSYPTRGRQEMSVHEAANQAAVDYLKKEGHECYMHSYID
jgi:hypothetical protein